MIKPTKEICIILTPDLSESAKDLDNFADLLIEKQRKQEALPIKLALNINPDYKNIINRLFHANIELYQWNAGKIMPFGILMTESAFLQTYLNNFNPKPIYDFGIFMENLSEDTRLGLEHLCIWCYTNLCKKVVFTKKSKTDKDSEKIDTESAEKDLDSTVLTQSNDYEIRRIEE